MNLKVQPVEVNYVAQVWPLVEQYLKDSLAEGSDTASPEWSKCYNIHHVQGFLTSGTWLLLVAVDENNKIRGAMTVSFANYPLSRIAFITLTGGQFIINQPVFEQMVAVLKQYGATKVQAYGRDSMVRLLRRHGFKPQTTLLETDI
jgi:hypothetical protein